MIQKKEKLTRAQVERFYRENKEAVSCLSIGVEDYIAARCCILNGLTSGYSFAAHGIERIMKAALMFSGERAIQKYNFRLQDLSRRLRTKVKLKINSHLSVIRKLERDWDLKRDHKLDQYIKEQKALGRQAKTLKEIDELVWFLLENLPIPEEVKFRIGLNGSILSGKGSGVVANSDSAWALRENDVLLKNLQPLLTRHSKVVARLSH